MRWNIYFYVTLIGCSVIEHAHILAQEKMDVSERLGQIYLSQGLTVGKIARKIAEKTGMSYRWVMTYLPTNVKQDLTFHSKTLNLDKGREKTPKSKVARLATGACASCSATPLIFRAR